MKVMNSSTRKVPSSGIGKESLKKKMLYSKKANKLTKWSTNQANNKDTPTTAPKHFFQQQTKGRRQSLVWNNVLYNLFSLSCDKEVSSGSYTGMTVVIFMG